MPAKEGEERGEEDGGHHQDEQALIAHAGGADLEDAANEGRHLPVVAAADGEERGLHESGEPEGEHEIERAGGPPAEAAVERRDEEGIHGEAEKEGAKAGGDHAEESGEMEEDHRGEEDVAAYREELPVGHVDDVQHAEDQGESDGEERVEATQHDALNQELKQGFQNARRGATPPFRTSPLKPGLLRLSRRSKPSRQVG